jgi:hypothetical protein
MSNHQILLDLVRSEQLTAEQIQHVLEDNPEFARWYRAQAKAGG